MGRLSFKTLYQKGVRLVRYTASLKIPVYASHASFFIALAVFPTLILLMSLMRYTGFEIRLLTELLSGVIPAALMPAAERLIVTTYYSTSSAVVSVSVLTALWSASRGIHGLRTGLNKIYAVEESRGYIYTRLVSVLYTFLLLLVLLLTLVLHVFGSALANWQILEESPFLSFLEDIIGLRFFVLLGVQSLVFTGVFMVLPNRKNRFMDSLPGALLASSGWLIFSDLYSIYVRHFAGLSNVYGSVYGVALSMLWLYCCVSILFYGGALNHWLMHNKS